MAAIVPSISFHVNVKDFSPGSPPPSLKSRTSTTEISPFAVAFATPLLSMAFHIVMRIRLLRMDAARDRIEWLSFRGFDRSHGHLPSPLSAASCHVFVIRFLDFHFLRRRTIRKVGSFRNRQVIDSSPIVGFILFRSFHLPYEVNRL